MTTKEKTAIILLSGGLDSLVSLACSKCEIKLGIIFDYGQNAFSYEKKAAEKIANHYGFKLEEIKLDWLKNITNNGLTKKEKIHSIENLNNFKERKKSMESVWVPNRNALFINIAAAYCEVHDIDCIIIGANKEESKTFKDNSADFITAMNKSLENSANKKIEVLAPLINFNKAEIVKEGIKNNVPFEYLYSCYFGEEKHCGKCESCLHLKEALSQNNLGDLIKKLF